MAIQGSGGVRLIAVMAMLILLKITDASAGAAESPANLASEPAAPQAAQKPKWPDCDSLENTPETRASVVDAYRLTPAVRKAAAESGEVPQGLRRRDIRLRDEVVIEVRNLDNLLRRFECKAMSGPKKSIVLYLDERPLMEVVAHPPVDPSHQVMIFPLKRTEKCREVWTHLLGKPSFGGRKVAVSLGIEDEYAIPSATYLDLEVVPRSLATGLIVLFLVLLSGFLWLSLTTGFLRSPTSPVCTSKDKPWSLARVQAAWWFFIILMSYVFIGVITGDFSTTITGTTLVLLTIAAGTTLTSSVIDNSKNTLDQQEREQAAKKHVEQEIAKLKKTHATKNHKTAEALVARNSQLSKLKGENEHFLVDILSDADGVCFHRFQNVVWSFFLGGVFVCAVYRELAMPQFSEALLGLMGLSAGTFVAMKNTESDTPKM